MEECLELMSLAIMGGMVVLQEPSQGGVLEAVLQNLHIEKRRE